ncbi:MAG: hypothetical protein Kow00121_04570 [Elainellaceae cyanobacterium]
MRVVIARTMPEFSMDIYAHNLVSELRAVRPTWEIVDLAPRPVDRTSRSLWVRAEKAYERFWRFPQFVQRQKADIFHIIDPAEAHIVYGLQKQRKPTVVTCHDLINFSKNYNLQGSVQLPLVSRNLWLRAVRGMCYADHICAVSAATAKDTTALLDIEPSRITVTPNGVSPVFQPLASEQIASIRQQYGLSPETFCLLNVGSNHPRKNILTVLKAVAILKQKGMAVQFWKVGADFTDEQTAFIQAQNLAQLVKHIGKPDQTTLLQLYNAADILVAPSLAEGFGLTLLEAMACGTPVITSNCSAMPEVAGEAGILIDPLNAEAIAQAVCQLHANPDNYQGRSQKGIARAKLFNWRNTAEQVAELYENVLSKRNLQLG